MWHYVLDDYYLRRNPHTTYPPVKKQVSIAPGASLEALEFVIRASDVGPDGLVARADDLGAGHGLFPECEEWNNDGPWEGACSPEPAR